MSFPAYASYRESGLSRLGSLPADWTTVPIKAVASWNDEVLSDTTAPDYELEYVEISDVQAGSSISGSTVYIFADAPSRARRRVRDGDIVVSTVRTYLRAIAPVRAPSDNLIVSTGFAVLRPKAVNPGFLAYAVESEATIGEIIARSVGVSYPAVNASDLVGIEIPLPSTPEQTAIAAFLDSETAKIDALVEEQRRLIALLKEKRQAVISHAVTKGLDPTVSMKDAGVEWLGEVPAHWDVRPLKRDLEYLTSGSRGWAEHYSDEGALFIRIGNLTRNSYELDLSDIQRVAVPEGAEGARTSVRAGDLLFSITAFLGSVAIAPDLGEPAYVSQHVALARLANEHLRAEWVALVTLSSLGKGYFAEQGYGGTKIQLSLSDVGGILLTVPPIHEQDMIIQCVREQLEAFDRLIREADAAILLLRERRAALISAAITGKIDVRSAAPQQAQAA